MLYEKEDSIREFEWKNTMITVCAKDIKAVVVHDVPTVQGKDFRVDIIADGTFTIYSSENLEEAKKQYKEVVKWWKLWK